MIQIAVVGIEGSGKTVLATVLAKRFSEWKDNEPYFEPMTPQTVKYVERAWKTLMSGEWPASTPPGELPILKWRLHFNQHQTCDLRMIDAAGQDIRLLFGEGQVNQVEALPDHLQELARSIEGADVILVLANLGDFLGVADAERRSENECAIKFVLDFVHKKRAERPPQICIVLTQLDRYQGELKKFRDLNDVVKKHLPSLHAAQVAQQRYEILGLAAISETAIASAQGTVRRVPATPIRSMGLNRLVEWLRQAVETVKNTPEPQPPPTQIVAPNQTESWLEILQSSLFSALGASAIGAITLFILYFLFPPLEQKPRDAPAARNEPALPARPTRPIPEFVHRHQQRNHGVFDDTLTIYGSVKNTGAAGKIRVVAWAVENEIEVDRRFQELVLNTGEVANYSIELPFINNLKNDIKSYIEAVVP